MRKHLLLRLLAVLLGVTLVATACGDDDDGTADGAASDDVRSPASTWATGTRA